MPIYSGIRGPLFAVDECWVLVLEEKRVGILGRGFASLKIVFFGFFYIALSWGSSFAGSLFACSRTFCLLGEEM